MEDILFKILPMVVCMTISQLIYSKLDKKFHMTNKLSKVLHIKREWIALVCFPIMVMISFILIYLITMPSIVFFPLSGLLTGIAVGMIQRGK